MKIYQQVTGAVVYIQCWFSAKKKIYQLNENIPTRKTTNTGVDNQLCRRGRNGCRIKQIEFIGSRLFDSSRVKLQNSKTLS